MLLNFFKLYNESGTDEAGRGCLAGPVTAAAVVLPESFRNTLINDSKLLSVKNRERLKPIIEEQSITYGVAHIHPLQIDEINILNASILAMHQAIDKLKEMPPHIIVDGNKFTPYKDVPHTCIV